MNIPSVKQQFKSNVVAIVSVLVALTGLGYNTWRNEKTEINRNVRVAAFEMLKNLGELQLIVDYAHFKGDKMKGDLTVGLSHVLYLRDLAQIVPAPVPAQTEKLLDDWRSSADKIENDNTAANKVSEDIYILRESLQDVLRGLR